jgi:flagellar operon protein
VEIKTGLSQIGGAKGVESTSTRPSVEKVSGGEGFDSVLKSQLGSLQQKPVMPNTSSGVKFSAHAIERLKSRGINLDQDTLQRLDQAIDKAAEKGSRESLMLTDDAALIVSVKNKTVITAMDRQMMKDNVFTNIDSTVII